MPSPACREELLSHWIPHLTTAGLNRLIELLESASSLLVHGEFGRQLPQGCLATHAAWHHPHTAKRTLDAGITWLSEVAHVNPATSAVLREWDLAGPCDVEFRHELRHLLVTERERRQTVQPSTSSEPVIC